MDSAVLRQLGMVGSYAVDFAEVCGEHNVVVGRGGTPSLKLQARRSQAVTRFVEAVTSLIGRLKSTRPETFEWADEKLNLGAYNLDALSLPEARRIITLLHEYVFELVKHELPMCGTPARFSEHAC